MEIRIGKMLKKILNHIYNMILWINKNDLSKPTCAPLVNSQPDKVNPLTEYINK
jgi:hypothetical protein